MSEAKSSKLGSSKIQELLDIVKQEEDSVLTYQDDVLQFLDFYNIKPGRHYIKTSILRQLYYNWSHEPIQSMILTARLNDYLRSLSKQNVQYCKINQNSLNLSKPVLEALARQKKRLRVVHHEKVFDFIQHYDIKPGGRATLGQVIHDAFIDWAKRNSLQVRKFKNPESFYTVFSLYFERKKDKSQLTLCNIDATGLEYQLQRSEKKYEEKQKKKQRKQLLRERKSFQLKAKEWRDSKNK